MRIKRAPLLGIGLLLGSTLATLSAADERPAVGGAVLQAPPRVLPIQRLERGPRGVETLESEHFLVRYDPGVLPREKAEEGRLLAEKAWKHCAERFGESPRGSIILDLSPRFAGATGFARPGDPGAKELDKRPLIGIRFADLAYLGLSAEYVMTHEVAHLFSGELAGATLGEGIADWGAGSFSGLPMRPWWGTALRDGGLWIEPDAFFVTGEFEPSPEVNAVIRTAQYVESGLLVRFLVERFGWAKFKRFAAEYSRARGRLESNEDRKSRPAPRPARGERNSTDPRKSPDPEAVRAIFERHFGESWTRLRADWEGEMAADRAPAGEARKLVLAQRIYGAIRNYEMWALAQKPPVPAPADRAVRQAFAEANHAVASGELDAGEAALARARSLVEQLRRPRVVAFGREKSGNFRMGRGV